MGEGGRFLPGLSLLRPETTWGNSRFDFLLGVIHRAARFCGSKGRHAGGKRLCPLPDAPTERGVKHLEELIACRAEGYETAVCFVLRCPACGIRT